jgi:hypothetical protein
MPNLSVGLHQVMPLYERWNREQQDDLAAHARAESNKINMLRIS